MALAVTQEELLYYLDRLSAERQYMAFEFIKFLAQEDETADERINVNEEIKRGLEEIRAGHVDRRDWRAVLDEL